MPKSKKLQSSKKRSSASANPSCQQAAAEHPVEPAALTTQFEDLTPEESRNNTPTTEPQPAEVLAELNLETADHPAMSPAAVDQLFSDDPEMAEEVGMSEKGLEMSPKIKKMLVNSALGPPVMLEKESGNVMPVEAEVSEEESRQIEMALQAIEAVERGEASFEQLIMEGVIGEALKESGENAKDLGPTVTESREEAENGSLSAFANAGFGEEDAEEAAGTKGALGKRHREESVNGNEEEEEEGNGEEGHKMMVCQIMDKEVMMVRLGKPDSWPRFVLVPKEMGLQGQLKLGDLAEVAECVEMGRFPNWLSDALKINAEADATKISTIFQNPTEDRVGIVMSMVKEKNGTPKAFDVALPESEVMQRIYRFQIDDSIDVTRIKPGTLINMPFVRIQRPPDIAIGPKGMYILPAKFETVSNREVLTHQPCIGTGIRDLTQGYSFPFTSDSVKVSEHGISAALAGALLKAKAEMEEFTINTKLYVLHSHGEMLVATFEHFMEEKRKFVDLTKIWEDDSAIVAKLKGAKKPCASGRVLETNKCFVKGMFLFQAKVMLHYQPARKYDAESDFEHISEGWDTMLIPCESFQALETRMALFGTNSLSCLANGTDGTSRIWQILLSMDEAPAVGLSSSEEQSCLASHPALLRLEGGQRTTAALMMDPKPRIVAQQAPPGSGKTFTLAAIVAALLSNPEAKILCLAPLNVAVVKMCEELVGALKTEGSDEAPLALFSGTGKGKYKEQLSRISGNLLEAAATTEEFWAKLEKKEKKEVKKYVLHAKKRPRIAKEAKIAEYVLNLERKRVLCCTIGFAEQIGRLLSDRNMVVLDEAGQAPFVQVCSTLAALAEIKKVLVTGDRFQLSVHMQSTPESVRTGFGFDTVLLNVDTSRGVDRTTLQTNYRSHWQIVECVASAAYRPNGEVLNPGPGSFPMLTDFFKMPVADSPLLLINQMTPMEAELTTFSATNSGQTRTVMDILELLRDFSGSIRVICLYAGQAAQVGKELKERGMGGVLAVTADSMQGNEADVTFVVTTVSKQRWTPEPREDRQRRERKSEFWGDPQRVNVALSRGKHGLVVVGDLMNLSDCPIWSRFFDKALEYTVVTNPSVIPSLKSNKSRYNHGLLVDEFGVAVQDYRFHADWNGTRMPEERWYQPKQSTAFAFRMPWPPISFPQQFSFRGQSSEAQRLSNVRSSTQIRCWRCDRLGHVSSQCDFPPRQQN